MRENVYRVVFSGKIERIFSWLRVKFAVCRFVFAGLRVELRRVEKKEGVSMNRS